LVLLLSTGPFGWFGLAALTLRLDTTSTGGVRKADGVSMSVARAGASRTMVSLPRMVRFSRRPWERDCVRAVIGIDAITSLATRRGFGGR
jgi:hypothetical protein